MIYLQSVNLINSKSLQELADYDKISDGPKLGAGRLRKDGFGEEKFFRCFVAHTGDKLVGYAMYFFTYSTWEGISVSLEDQSVTLEFRN